MAKKDSKGHSSGGNPRRKVSHAQTYGAVMLEFPLILREYGTGTVDLIHRRLEIPESARMKIGPAIRQLAADGVIVRVEFTPTERAKAHGRHVSVWRLAG